jgi:hypothetical protein
VPSLKERRAPVNAPPIAAFFCFIKEGKKHLQYQHLTCKELQTDIHKRKSPISASMITTKRLATLMFCGATSIERPLVSKVRRKYLVCDFFHIPQDSNMKI